MKQNIAIIILTILPLSLIPGGCGFNNNDSNITPQPNDSLYDWTRQAFSYNYDLKDVYFDHNHNGWIVGEKVTVFSSSGQSWSLTPVVVETEATFRSVFFIDASHGWIAGDLKGTRIGGQVAYSGIGGAYPIQQVTVDYPLNAIFFIDSKNLV